MAQTGRTKDGRFVMRAHDGQDWREVSEEVYAQARQGRLERTVGSFGDALQDTAGFIAEGAAGGGPFGFANPAGMAQRLVDEVRGETNPVAQLGADIQAQNDARQEARMAVDPPAAIGGYVAEAALPLPTPPVSNAARKGYQIARGSVEAVSGRVGGAVGQAARKLPVVGDEIEGLAIASDRIRENARINESLSAAASGGERYRKGLMSSDEFAAYARSDDVLSPAMRGYLDAGDREFSDAMRSTLKEQSLRERTDPGIVERFMAGDRDSLQGAYSNMRDAVNQRFMETIGADRYAFPDRLTVGDNLRRISDEFGEIEKLVQSPYDGQMLIKDIDKIAQQQLTDRADRAIERVKADVKKLTDASGMVEPNKMNIVRNRLEADLRRMAQGQSDIEIVQVLSDIRDRIRQQMISRLNDTNPAMVPYEKELRQQWGNSLSALTRSGTIGEEGINPRSFLNTKGSKDRMTKTGRRKDDLTRFMETADALLKVIPRSSQTPEGLSRQGLSSVLR